MQVRIDGCTGIFLETDTVLGSTSNYVVSLIKHLPNNNLWRGLGSVDCPPEDQGTLYTCMDEELTSYPCNFHIHHTNYQAHLRTAASQFNQWYIVRPEIAVHHVMRWGVGKASAEERYEIPSVCEERYENQAVWGIRVKKPSGAYAPMNFCKNSG